MDTAPHTADPPLGVRLSDVSMSFPQAGGRLDVLDEISLDVAPGSFVSLLGPSGAGKSTLLGIVAGLEEPTGGEVTLYTAGGPSPGPRLGRVGYMPQRDLLLPWRSALGNATAGLEVRGVPKPATLTSAMSLFDEFGLAGFAGVYPNALSGGMRQRVSFARSSLASRGLMLLDEPFGALDSLTRAALQEWLLGVWDRLGATIILVTHDIDEAVLLSDCVYVVTPRPARIAERALIDLPRPRTLDTMASAEFARCKLGLLAALRAAGGLPEASDQWSVVSGRQSAISSQPSAVSSQQSAVGGTQAVGSAQRATETAAVHLARSTDGAVSYSPQPSALSPQPRASHSPQPVIASQPPAAGRQPHAIRNPQSAIRAVLPAVVAVVLLVLFWEGYVDLTHLPRRILPAPSQVGEVLLADAGVLAQNAWVTLVETGIGFAAAMAVGLGCAVLIDRSDLLRRAIYPLLVASQTVPSIAYAPLLVIWFGYELLPKVLVVLVYCFFPVTVAALDGFRATDPELIRLFRTFGASGRQIFSWVRFPNALPAIFSGIRIAITYSVTGAIVGEYVGAYEGLGVYIQRVKNSFAVDRVFAAILVIALLSVGLFALVSLVERIAVPWAGRVSSRR
ncbi:MAG: ABC transporter permease subunit [Chloroflexia bacterium]